MASDEPTTLHTLPENVEGVIRRVHELFKRPSQLLRHTKKGSFKTAVTQTLNDGYRDEDHATTTLPPPLQLGITVTTSLCKTAPHCRQSTKFSNCPCIFLLKLMPCKSVNYFAYPCYSERSVQFGCLGFILVMENAFVVWFIVLLFLSQIMP
jgi:hypothetical protein